MAVGTIYNDGVYRYTVLTEDGTTGTVSIGAYTTESVVGNVTLPEKFITGSMVYDVTAVENGYVNSIVTQSFTYCKYLTGLTIPDSILSIYGYHNLAYSNKLSYVNISKNINKLNNGIFRSCTSLNKINLLNVNIADQNCFRNCTSLKEINIPNSVTTFNVHPFTECSNLRRLYIGNGLISVATPSTQFSTCTKLEEVYVDSQYVVDHFYIGDSVTSIGNNAFLSGSSLREVHLGKNIQSIGINAFNRCLNLHYINLPDSLQHIENYALNSIKSYVLNIPQNATMETYVCRFIDSFYINYNGNDNEFNSGTFDYMYQINMSQRCKLTINSNKVWKIGSNCFYNSNTLYDLRFPASIKYIDTNAFGNIATSGVTSNVHSLIFEGNCPITASAIFNDGYNANFKIYYYENTEGWSSTFGNKNIPTQEVFRGDYEYDNLLYRFVDGHDYTPNVSVRVKPGVKLSGAVNIPQTITIKGLTYTVRYIAEEGFAEQYNITSIDLHNQFISIGKNGFRNCSKLTTVSNLNHLQDIYEGAFDGCSELTSFNITYTVYYLFKNAFRNCEQLQTLSLSPNIAVIEDNCFENCKSLTSITFGDKLQNLGKNCFKNCESLKTVTYGTALEEIPESCFMNCKSLTSFTASSTNNLKRIRDYAFTNCFRLTAAPISAATQIGQYAFYYNQSITSLTLPSTIDYIKDCAFANCNHLTSLTNNTTTLADFGENVFYNTGVTL